MNQSRAEQFPGRIPVTMGSLSDTDDSDAVDSELVLEAARPKLSMVCCVRCTSTGTVLHKHTSIVAIIIIIIILTDHDHISSLLLLVLSLDGLLCGRGRLMGLLLLSLDALLCGCGGTLSLLLLGLQLCGLLCGLRLLCLLQLCGLLCGLRLLCLLQLCGLLCGLRLLCLLQLCGLLCGLRLFGVLQLCGLLCGLRGLLWRCIVCHMSSQICGCQLLLHGAVTCLRNTTVIWHGRQRISAIDERNHKELTCLSGPQIAEKSVRISQLGLTLSVAVFTRIPARFRWAICMASRVLSSVLK